MLAPGRSLIGQADRSLWEDISKGIRHQKSRFRVDALKRNSGNGSSPLPKAPARLMDIKLVRIQDIFRFSFADLLRQDWNGDAFARPKYAGDHLSPCSARADRRQRIAG
jgi:hypothetical protein